MIRRVNKPEEVINFAWDLSQNELHASYHRIKSIKEIKEKMKGLSQQIKKI